MAKSNGRLLNSPQVLGFADEQHGRHGHEMLTRWCFVLKQLFSNLQEVNVTSLHSRWRNPPRKSTVINNKFNDRTFIEIRDYVVKNWYR